MQEPAETRVPLPLLQQFCQEILQAVGLPAESAATVADSLAQADASGLFSHGAVRLLPVYTRRLRAGTMRTHPHIQVIRRRGSVALMDGDAGPGQVVGSRAMQLAMGMARENGVGVVGVRNSSHFGAGAYFTRQAVAQGLIGVALSNAPANMPPWGGRTPYLGTNPLSVGIPCGQETPVLLDMSTSVVARGKIVIAARTGSPIPEGWAIDRDGHPTRDPEAALAGAVLPMGGYKGSGLALVIDALCGVLTGAAFGVHIVNLYDDGDQVQNLGHFFMALDVEAFMPLATFQQRMDQFLQEIRAQPRMPGVERIYTPGEIEAEQARRHAEQGIPLPDLAELDRLAEELGVQKLSERLVQLK